MKIMKKTSVDKFLYGSNMSESEKIKMWQDQHAFEQLIASFADIKKLCSNLLYYNILGVY